jgi:hypothetical protein
MIIRNYKKSPLTNHEDEITITLNNMIYYGPICQFGLPLTCG